MRVLIPVFFFSTALAGPDPAHAVATAEVRFDSFSYQLVDLRPDDGVAPGITFTGGAAPYPNSHLRSLVITETARPEHTAEGSGPFGSVNHDYDDGNTRVGLVVAGDGTFGGMSLTASASTESMYFSSWVTSKSSFLLTPYTLATFSVTMSAQTTADTGYADAGLYFTVAGPGAAGTGGQQAHIERWVGTRYDHSLQESTSFAFPFVNLSDTSIEGSVYARAALDGFGWGAPATPVPEPHAGLLTLAGLGALMAWHRRRPRRRHIAGEAA